MEVERDPKCSSEANTGSGWVAIAPMRMELVESYRQCLGCVARERKYLMMTEAPTPEQSREFVEWVLQKNFPNYVALVPGPRVVGWCDIAPSGYESRAHVGTLGIAVHADYRGQGIGPLLMDRALKHARLIGLERVELEVFGSNVRAAELYKRFGFEVEGLKRRARKFGETYEDVVVMAKLL